MLMGIVLGIVGAILGGRICSVVGHSGVGGFNIYSIFVSVIGAVIVLFVYHAIHGITSHRGSM
jgi:uncharacterized membrane protein YeaQ/YmgE (transglycosylase-associated protein family)